MAINEEIVTGRKFRKLIDEATKLWQRISFWTKASDVEFDDGQTAEKKMGAISGITDSLVSTSSNIAASAKALNQLNNKLIQQPTFTYDSTGKITGYKTPGGADTVFPFKRFSSLIYGVPANLSNGDWVIVAGTCSVTAYHNMQPTNIVGGDLIFYADSGGSWTSYVAIIEATSSTVTFTPGYSETKGTRACLRQ